MRHKKDFENGIFEEEKQSKKEQYLMTVYVYMYFINIRKIGKAFNIPRSF